MAFRECAVLIVDRPRDGFNVPALCPAVYTTRAVSFSEGQTEGVIEKSRSKRRKSRHPFRVSVSHLDFRLSNSVFSRCVMKMKRLCLHHEGGVNRRRLYKES